MRQKKGTPTIYDIAAAAQVSPSTVSRVFSNSNYPVAAPTRAHIFEIAKQLGYHYKKVQSTPELPESIYAVASGPQGSYYMQMFTDMELALRAHNINMILKNSDFSVKVEQEIFAELAHSKAPIIVSPFSDELSHIEACLAEGSQVLLLEAALPGKCSSIQSDNRAAGRMAVQYLAERGLRKIAYLSPAPYPKHPNQGIRRICCRNAGQPSGNGSKTCLHSRERIQGRQDHLRRRRADVQDAAGKA